MGLPTYLLDAALALGIDLMDAPASVSALPAPAGACTEESAMDLTTMKTNTLVALIMAGHVPAAAEATRRIKAGENGKKRLRAALTSVLVDEPETVPVPDVPETPETPETPVVRIYEKTWTKELAALVRKGDVDAVAEANLRLGHKHTLKPYNARTLERAIAGEPEKAPREAKAKAPKSAANAYAQRLKLLVDKSEQIPAGIRSHRIAKDGGWSLEDVTALSDEECVELFRAFE